MESLKVKYLDANTVSDILSKIEKKDSSIAYNCKVSRTSSSIYFRLYSKDTEAFVSRRISDHPSSRDIITLIVGPSTKYKHVENFILKAVKQLGKRRRAILWQNVKKEQIKNEEPNNKTS